MKSRFIKSVFHMTLAPYSSQYAKLRSALVAQRKKASLTQSDLAIKLNKPQSFVSKYERGERRLDVIECILIAKALGIDPLRFLRQFIRD